MANSKYLLHPKHPLRTIVYIILALGLLVGGYFTFKASQTSTEGRSKAALNGKVYKRWEFNGATTEGWVEEGLQSLAVRKGKLNAVMADTPANSNIAKKDINAGIGIGNKYLTLRMAVGKLQKSSPGVPIPTYVFVEDDDIGEGGEVDCNTTSSGVTTCSGDGTGTSTNPGQDSSGAGTSNTNPDSYSGSTGSNAGNESFPCVPKPKCDPGKECIDLLSYPRGGWCPDATPTPSCTPCADPSGFCPLENYGAEPPGGWCPPQPPCQPRPSCLDAKPACKKLTPPGGWCPTSEEFEFTITYGYEEPPVGGNEGTGLIAPERVEKTATVRGKANGKLYTYNINLPIIPAVKILDLKIVFTSGVTEGRMVNFDWIRLRSGILKAKKGKIRVGELTPAPRITGVFSTCGKRCTDDSGCGGTLTCIQPVSIQCQGFGCRTKPAKRVCALAPAQNAKGYICE